MVRCYPERLRKFFSGVDWTPPGGDRQYSLRFRGQRIECPKPPIAYFRAVLVKMLLEISSFSKLVDRLQNNPDLAFLRGFTDLPSKMNFYKFMKKLQSRTYEKIFEEALNHLRMEV